MIDTPDHIFAQSPYRRRISQLTDIQLKSIDECLQSLLDSDSPSLNKTHFFEQRFENIYIESPDHDALNQLMDESLEFCAEFLELDPSELSISYWFNLMQPGHSTTLHRHDDHFELLSGVVYLTVPDNSGNLVLHDKDSHIELEPVPGNFIFFHPATPHAVNTNHSFQHRLSIGMNIGHKANRL